MNGKVVAGAIVLSGLVAGAALWYLQVYGFYEPIEAASPAAAIRLTPVAGKPEEIIVAGFQGIDADSSPLRFRGCFTTPTALATLTETYQVYDNPTPLIAPGWFDCFDAGQLTEDLATGAAVAFLSEANIHQGVDRVVAVYPDGRAYAWHQLNESAEN
ncbi:MAG: hypothetical protein RLZZ528_2876 [Pseudomonadota bacterium]